MKDRTRSARWILATVAVLAIGACGDDGDGDGDDAASEVAEDLDDVVGGAPDAPSTDVTVEVPDDACDLLSEASVEEIAGGPTTATPADSPFGDDFGPSVRCMWTNDDFLPPVEVMVTGNPEVFEYGRGLVEELGSIDTEEVTGVGDEAYTFDEGSGVLELDVRSGDRVIQVRAATDDGAALIALANEVVLNL